jgi:Na+/melibiose symporter-like transporter
MSAILSRPRMPVPRSTIAPPVPEHLDAHLAAAVRDGAVRATVAVGLGALAAIHAVDAVGKWTETRYMFWMYMAAIVAAVVAAAAVVLTRSRTALLVAAAIAGSVLLGYVVDRTIGMPNATGDIGNWTEPLGLTSMVVEGLTVAVALAGAALPRAARTVVA